MEEELFFLSLASVLHLGPVRAEARVLPEALRRILYDIK
jgi:hypothetical protein